MATKRDTHVSAHQAAQQARKKRQDTKATREQAAAMAPANTSSPTQALRQLAALDKRLGKGVGAQRERQRLAGVLSTAARKTAKAS